MSLPPILEDLYRDIRSQLEVVEDEIRGALDTEHEAVRTMVDHLGGYQGKRLRPALVMILARASGADLSDVRFPRLGAVVEMIHLATLVHDDVIDEAVLRRRRETVNARWSNYDAVLLGDIVFSRAIRLLGRIGDQRALITLTGAVSTLCEGEILQNRHRRDADLREETYYRIIEDKTAILYASACELAAHLGGASDEMVSAFRCYGLELGKAFQIVDDCLDMTGTEREVGKSLGTDLRLGKMTLPLILLREEGGEECRRLLERIIAAPDPDPRDLSDLKTALLERGAIAGALDRARRHAGEAVTAVRPHVDPRTLACLEAVSTFVFERRT